MAEGLACFEPKKPGTFGKWIVINREVALELKCPACGFEYVEAEPNVEKGDIYKYCPECGGHNE